MDNAICAFISDDNAILKVGIKRKILQTMLDLLKYKGIDTFYLSNENKFDKFCYQTATELKKEYDYLKRKICVLDYVQLRVKLKKLQVDLKDYELSKTIPLLSKFWNKRFNIRNEVMILESKIVVFHLVQQDNIDRLVKFANDNNKEIIFI